MAAADGPEPDRRRRAGARGVHRRARPRSARARAVDDRATPRRRPLLHAVHARSRSRAGDRPPPTQAPPPPRRAEARRRGSCDRRRSVATARSHFATARSSSSRTPAASAAPRSSAFGWPTSTSTRRRCTCSAREGRSASSRSASERRTRSPSTSAMSGRASHAGANDSLFLSVRGRSLDTSTLRRLMQQPAPPPARVRDAPARGRRRPPDDPGAARSRLALDDADLQPRRRAAAPAGLRLEPSPLVTLCARRSNRRRAESGPAR